MPSTQIKELAEHNIHVFLEAYSITNDQGEKLDFKEHAYMWDIYSDWTPNIVGLKAAQVTWSTCFNIKSLYAAKVFGVDIIYSLPSSSDIGEFVSSKTNRLIANNPIFQEWTADKDSIEQKQIGKSIIYYRGTWTERAAIAIPADVYICDERDRSKQAIVVQMATRMQHSKFGWQWSFSNPSVAGFGVDEIWQRSDQKHWFIKCYTCNHEWYLTMDNIMFKGGKAYFGCLKCKTELDRHKGRWIAKRKDRSYHPVDNPSGISGYWVSLLMAPRFSAQYILDKQKEYSEEQFTNFVLGLPYVGKGNKLTLPMVLQNFVNGVNPRDSSMIIGVDTGVGINYVLGNKYGLFFYDKCDSYAPLKKLMRDNPTAIMIIDQGGDIIGPRELREEFPNRVYLCFFRADQKNDTLIKWNDDEGTVQADRNKLIQLVVDETTDKRMPIYGTPDDWSEFTFEWLSMYRTQEENALGIPVFKWNKPASGRCDYPFAHVYWRIGMDRFLDTSATFHEAKGGSFAQTSIDVHPDGTGTIIK